MTRHPHARLVPAYAFLALCAAALWPALEIIAKLAGGAE